MCKKQSILQKILFTVVLSILVLMPTKIWAASFKKLNLSDSSDYIRVGKVTFSMDYNWNGISTLYAMKGSKQYTVVSEWGLSTIILTDGTWVYYQTDDNQRNTSYLYKVKYNGTGNTYIDSFNRDEDGMELSGIYKGKIFFVDGIFEGKFYSYTEKTGRLRLLARDAVNVDQYGQYFLLYPYNGDGSACLLRSFNASTNKIKQIWKYVTYYTCIDRQLYYVKHSGDNPYPYSKVSICRCKLNGSGKKTLISSLTVKYIEKITRKYVVYTDKNDKRKKKYF